MTLNMDGFVEVKASGTVTSTQVTDTNKVFFFQKDGTLSETSITNGDYKTQALGDGNGTKCAASVSCAVSNHPKDTSIIIYHNGTKWVAAVANAKPVGP